MMIVALTGGIGSGKTTVAKMFTELGVPVYNSDEEAKLLMQSSKTVKNAIVALLGREAYHDKKLNRTYIAEKVFNDKDLLLRLNRIVHPAVKKHFMVWAQKQNAPYVIQEAAIIFENLSYTTYDKIILVTAPKDIRVHRVMDRDASSEEEVLIRMQNQWDDSQKAKLSDFVIENIDLEQTKQKVRKIHDHLVNALN